MKPQIHPREQNNLAGLLMIHFSNACGLLGMDSIMRWSYQQGGH